MNVSHKYSIQGKKTRIFCHNSFTNSFLTVKVDAIGYTDTNSCHFTEVSANGC